MNNILIYTDGACRGNGKANNIGAYAYKLICGDKIKTYSHAVKNTTNNIMELSAVIYALQALKSIAINYSVHVYTDSAYVVQGMNSWIYGWILKDFYGVKNADLWKQLLQLKNKFPNIEFIHVKGHADNVNNIEVDKLCNQAMDLLIQQGI